MAGFEVTTEVLAQHGIGSGCRGLDAVCGTGRYAVELAQRGFEVCGVDNSPELIAVAKSRINSVREAEFLMGDLLTVSLRRSFDFVLCRGVLNDFITDASRRNIFQRFSTWLRPAGMLIFDVREWAKTVARYAQNPHHWRSVELPNGVLRFHSETRLDHKTKRMLVHERFDIQEGEESRSTENDFTMQPWTAHEITGCLRLNGLREVGVYTGYGAADPLWRDRLVVIATKSAA